MKQILSINGLEVEASLSEDSITDLFLPFLHTIKQLQEQKQERILVFLSAPPATGKSTLVELLSLLAEERMNYPEIQGIGIDGFHYPNEVLEAHNLLREKGSIRSFNVKKLQLHLEKLKQLSPSSSIFFPVYDRITHQPREHAVELNKKVILLEGNYLATPQWELLKQYSDYNVFITAQEEELKQRLIQRKLQGGSSNAQAKVFYESSDKKNIHFVLQQQTEVQERWLFHQGEFSKDK